MAPELDKASDLVDLILKYRDSSDLPLRDYYKALMFMILLERHSYGISIQEIMVLLQELDDKLSGHLHLRRGGGFVGES